MVDEYLQNDFEGVLSGGLKTKFKVVLCLFSISMSQQKAMASVTNKFSSVMINSSISTYQ